jgi:hypothetical protein
MMILRADYNIEDEPHWVKTQAYPNGEWGIISTETDQVLTYESFEAVRIAFNEWVDDVLDLLL